MSHELEAYRKQREQIRAHLAWLDEEIRRQEDNLKQPSPAAMETGKTAVEKALDASPANAPETAPLEANPVETPTEATSKHANTEDLEAVIKHYAPSEQSNLAATKVGCALTILGLTVIFLFGMFVLPNWLFD